MFMKRKTKNKIFRILQKLFNVMMGIGYLAVAYLFIFIAMNSENLRDSALTIILICICGMGQISQYQDAYKEAKKDIFYYIGIIPPAIAIFCIVLAVCKMYFFS